MKNGEKPNDTPNNPKTQNAQVNSSGPSGVGGHKHPESTNKPYSPGGAAGKGGRIK